MKTHAPSPSMTLAELVDAAAALLDRAGVDVGDDRVADRPDARTVRYYQSTGVVDRPMGYRGRLALYGRRHLLQVVCTKLLQARGYSLAQVQRALAGATDVMLESAVSDAIGAAATGLGARVAPPPAAEPSGTPAPDPAAPRAVAAFELAPGVVLTIDPAHVADPAALAAHISSLLRGDS